MIRLKKFLKTTLLGGVTVILPVVLTYYFLRWLYEFVIRQINPLTRMMEKTAQSNEYTFLAHLLSIFIIVLTCFSVGLSIKTKIGRFIYHTIEIRILKIAPGYTLFKETIKQFLGQDRAPFSRVALVDIYGTGVLMTGFITDEHPEGIFTVYVPSGLNPTTGLIFHMEKQRVHVVDMSVEETMRSIIGCGSGSSKLIEKYIKQKSNS